MDRGAWQATVHGITKSRTWLSNLSTAHCGKWCFIKIVCNFKARSRSVLVVSFLCSSTSLLNRMHFSRAEWYYWELLGLLCVILSLAAAEECFNILEKWSHKTQTSHTLNLSFTVILNFTLINTPFCQSASNTLDLGNAGSQRRNWRWPVVILGCS